jgi:hypothetical protein
MKYLIGRDRRESDRGSSEDTPVGDLNAKHPFRNNVVSNYSGAKLLNLMHVNELEISSQKCPSQ